MREVRRLSVAQMSPARFTRSTVRRVIVTRWDWRWIFFINLPIGLATLLATFLVVPDLRIGRRQRLDLVGVLLTTLGLFLVVFGLIEGQRFSWGLVWGVVTVPEVIAAGGLVMSVFIYWERRQAEPLLPLSLFADRTFLLMNSVVAAMSFGMLGLSFLLPIYLQSALGMTAFQSGLTVAPMPLALMIVAPFAGRLTDRRNGVYLPIAGLLLLAMSMGLIVWLAGAQASGPTFLSPMILGGVSIAFVMPPSTTLAVRGIDLAAAGAASGMLNTTRHLGGVVGSAIVGALFQIRLAAAVREQAMASVAQMPAQLGQPFVEGFVAAMRPALLVPIALLAITALGSLAIVKRPQRPPFDGDPTSLSGGRPEMDDCSMRHGAPQALLDGMTRLLIVESRLAIRVGLRMRLKLEPDVTIVGEAGNGLAALSQAAVVRPDVILLDIESAGMDGVELIRALRKASPESAVVALSLSDDAVTRRRVAAAGAVAFVSKRDCGDCLLQTVRQAVVREDGSSVNPERPNHMGKALA